MAAKSIEAITLRDDDLDLELRYTAGTDGAALVIEVRHDGETLGHVECDAELTRALRLAIQRLEDGARPAKSAEPAKAEKSE
jgi:hypothetical protein